MSSRDIIKPRISYDREPSHQWTDYHDAVVDHHFKLGEMPHVETHTKAQAMTWMHNIGDYFQTLSKDALIASIGSFLIHHYVEGEEAKRLALELSHHCGSVSMFASLIGSFWDKHISHTQREGQPIMNTGRLATAHFRSQAQARMK
ncbi:MAG: hypothetical protein KME46_32700 [Brasilonema angustatum HA4187-MV1]|jgi:hypothetical protein|nr:hypothetical protein [Brasilonema angustatum HA4187-MV1]